jgi:CBS domain-containing protein
MVMSEPPESSGRTMHLMDGRRVTLEDLIEAGLLKIGERVRFSRPRMGVTYSAEVTEPGRLRLDDGLEYRSPSRAAMVAANMRAVDGWHVWVLESTGAALDSLRQELLDRAVATSAESSDDHDGVGESAARLHEWLRSVRSRAESKTPERVSVRELLAQWGVRDRGDQITRIEADLANHGLATRPNFRGVTLETEISIITAAQEAEQETEESKEVAVVSPDDVDEDDDDRYIGLMVGNLPSALSGVVSVAPTASLREAITKMLLNDYSQLAVLAGAHTLRGAVTWQSIAQARHLKPEATLADATVAARDVGYRTDLLEVLVDLQKRGFLFVRDENNGVAGIVTAADVAGRYGDMANPFILIGDLDRLLRRAIARAVPIDEVISHCDPQGRRLSGHKDMSMGDYQRVLENPALWSRMGWDLDQKSFVARLGEIRRIRNDVMHFNPDPVPPNTVDQLRSINEVLRRYAA